MATATTVAIFFGCFSFNKEKLSNSVEKRAVARDDLFFGRR